ncbi:MAG: hypothetical protein ABI183_14180 [Polyangiaceae bacterium]
MKRRKQIFESPDGSLSVDVFIEHWEVILAFARTTDAALGDFAEACSYSSDPHDVVRVATHDLETIVAFLFRVRTNLESAAPLEPEPTADILENFSNSELGRMLGDVIGVLREAIRLERPFRAWRE